MGSSDRQVRARQTSAGRRRGGLAAQAGSATLQHGAERNRGRAERRRSCGGEVVGGNGAGSVVRCHREGRVRREARRLGAASENPSGLDGQAARSGCLDIAAPRTGCLIGGSYRFLGRKQVSGERVPGDDVGGGGGETGLAARAGIGMRVTHTCTCTRALKVDPPVSAATPRPFLLSRLRLHRATRPAGLLGLKAAPARHSGLWRSGGRLLGPPRTCGDLDLRGGLGDKQTRRPVGWWRCVCPSSHNHRVGCGEKQGDDRAALDCVMGAGHAASCRCNQLSSARYESASGETRQLVRLLRCGRRNPRVHMQPGAPSKHSNDAPGAPVE